jgi:hypothetical protein
MKRLGFDGSLLDAYWKKSGENNRKNNNAEGEIPDRNA